MKAICQQVGNGREIWRGGDDALRLEVRSVGVYVPPGSATRILRSDVSTLIRSRGEDECGTFFIARVY